jgi:hypothetical protein
MHDPVQTTCTVCGSPHVRILVDIPSLPVLCNRLHPTRAEALAAPKGRLALAFCPACGHVYNAAFDPELTTYTQAYENSLHFSPSFQRFAEALADGLIERYNLRGKDIIDLGCGKGDFLKLICARGENRGMGFDPSYVPDPADHDPASRVKFIREFYSERHTSYPVDLISCRHVLEHIPEPRTMIAGLRRSVGARHSTAIYFEVPNVLFTLRDLGIWDLIYEHCSYFSAPSLAHLFTSEGFDVRSVEESFGGQYLGLEASPAAGSRGSGTANDVSPASMEGLARAFADRHREKIGRWNAIIEDMRRNGKRAVVWGGGSKGVTFLNSIRSAGVIDVMVDINPRKRGLFVPGTGQRLIAPEELPASPPDIVIIMNPLYEAEIRGNLHALGIGAGVLVAQETA